MRLYNWNINKYEKKILYNIRNKIGFFIKKIDIDQF